MSESEHEPSFDEIESGVITALNQFDQEREGLYDWLASVAAKEKLPEVNEYGPTTSAYLDGAATAFQELVHQIRIASENPDVAKEQIGALLRQDDNERVELFKNLVDCGCFEALDEETTSHTVEDWYGCSENEEEFAKNVYFMYRAYAANDVSVFAEHLEGRRQEVPDIQSDQYRHELSLSFSMPTIRKETVKLAALAVGAAIGMTLLHKLNKES
jgi:hypothetical protein